MGLHSPCTDANIALVHAKLQKPCGMCRCAWPGRVQRPGSTRSFSRSRRRGGGVSVSCRRAEDFRVYWALTGQCLAHQRLPTQLRNPLRTDADCPKRASASAQEKDRQTRSLATSEVLQGTKARGKGLLETGACSTLGFMRRG